ncbi:hypothetical protein PRIPAC_78193, partial [Pristionchus pacificus]|uniref:Uncharacterized protein n=1 Tax=Pristionchus pacificus TaxID=54126 RepID=A0A2A6CKA4_PRIPA
RKVFSYEEVKYVIMPISTLLKKCSSQLINSVLEVSTRFVCLVPQNGYTGLNQLEKIFAQTDKVSTSFAILRNAQCIERPNESPWRIVADLPVDLDCIQEFSLILQPNINVIREQVNRNECKM